MSLFKKLTVAVNNQKTYQVGLLQTKAYRILKQRTAEFLERSDISTVEWALLGVLNDSDKGMQLHTLAEELGVEPPFVTRMMARLANKELLGHMPDPQDNRAKIIYLTKKGRKFVDETELLLRDNMRDILKNTPKKDILSYLQVLQDIVSSDK